MIYGVNFLQEKLGKSGFSALKPNHKPTAKSVRICRVNFLAFSRLTANLTSQVNKG